MIAVAATEPTTAISLNSATAPSDNQHAARPAPPQRRASRLSPASLGSAARTVGLHILQHTGAGIVCAVAYFDPGNWGVDLQAGSQYGYKLLFVVLLAGLFAIYMQVLASRLGCVTGLDLAAHCRLLLHDRPRNKLFYRWAVLYPLYALSEIAIVCTDLAELLGSAMALSMLFPSLDVWAGVLITTADVLLLLAMRNPIGGHPVRGFELGIAVLVLIVLICMAVIISKTEVNWAAAFDGFVPSKTLFQAGGLYTSIGIIGATVMPHSLFLGSALATQDRIKHSTECPASASVSSSRATAGESASESSSVNDISQPHVLLKKLKEAARATVQLKRVEGDGALKAKTHDEWTNRPLEVVRRHIYHGIVDMVISLLGLAVVINALILVLAAAVFFYGTETTPGGPATLFDAYALIRDRLGVAAATLFALALLAAGQSSSIIATLAAQIVSEGFIQWHISPVLTRLVTRCLGIIPSLVVAIGVGREGISVLLVASQVVLSIVLPFVTLPLIYFTSSSRIMTVYTDAPVAEITTASTSMTTSTTAASDDGTTGSVKEEIEGAIVTEIPGDLERGRDARKRVDFSNGKIMVAIGVVIWLIIVAANIYAIIGLAMGEEA